MVFAKNQVFQNAFLIACFVKIGKILRFFKA